MSKIISDNSPPLPALSSGERGDEKKDEVTLVLSNIHFVDLRPIWPKLVEYISDIEDDLKTIYDWYGLTILESKEWVPLFPRDCKVSLPSVEEYQKELKPWLKWPLILFSFPRDLDDPWYSLDLEEWRRTISSANSIKDPSWWTYLHGCNFINGLILLPLLRKAHKTKFMIANTPSHTWVIDENGLNYDLYWSITNTHPNLEPALDESRKVILTAEADDPCKAS